MHVKLVTGETAELVQAFDLPEFNEMPAVLIWGSRVFQARYEEDEDGYDLYDECFAYVIVEEAK